ncbi:HD-GYP domain-containing protein [Lacimicrobium sp. SS2-24]|uniref:HD-GYP domain-containing protein n=1 Tax=Lacimicrobium sp. SS2-24 TaxID=2005569 RepID=UPI000B4BA57A|nr:HD-GYP domain-containing protein [Lacimicrobium sp. SS2-24]
MSRVKIHPDMLQLGMYVRLPSGWMKHPFMRNSFLLTKTEQIRIIRSLKLPFVIIDGSKSQVQPTPEFTAAPAEEEPAQPVDALREEMEDEKKQRIEELKKFRRSLQKTEKAYGQSLSQVRSLMNKLSSRPLQAIEESNALVGNLVETILSENGAILHLMNTDNQQEDLYYHSLNVCVLALMLAKQCGISKAECMILGQAALFHDIGKQKIPSQILRKPTALTKPEANMLKMHSQYTVQLLEHAPQLEKAILTLALQHHEYMDGSGYPKGLKQQDLHPLAPLLILVNSYDSLCHPREPENARIPYSALSYMFKSMRSKLPEKELKLFVKLLGIYPPGTVVQLSDKSIGLVMSVNTNDLLHPSIIVYDENIPRTEAPLLDLKDNNLKIVKAIKPSQLPQPVYEYLNPRLRVSYYVDKAPM